MKAHISTNTSATNRSVAHSAALMTSLPYQRNPEQRLLQIYRYVVHGG